MLQRFSVSVSEKKPHDSKSGQTGAAAGGHHEKVRDKSGGSQPAGHGAASAASAALMTGVSSVGGRDSESRNRGESVGNTSVKKEPLDSHRDRHGRYSPPDFGHAGYQHRLSPHHPGSYHGYHVDKTLLPPSLSGPHSNELHGQKYDFFRPNNTESDANRGLQSHGLC